MCTLTNWRRIPPPPEKFGAAASRIWSAPAGKRTAARLRGLNCSPNMEIIFSVYHCLFKFSWYYFSTLYASKCAHLRFSFKKKFSRGSYLRTGGRDPFSDMPSKRCGCRDHYTLRTRLPFNRVQTTREQDTQTCFFAPVTLTLTRWPWHTNLS